MKSYLVRSSVMRILFFLNFIALAYDNWKVIIFPEEQLPLYEGVAISFWASFALLNGIGVRFPWKMVPILILQLLYKAAWILGTYLPAYKAGAITDDFREFLWICVAGILLDILVIPWVYVYKQYLKGFFTFNLRHATTTQ